jgi:hypothetical protein
MFDKPFGPSQIAAIAAAKGVRATACGQVIGKAVEHALIELFCLNVFNRGPFSQVSGMRHRVESTVRTCV